MLEGARVRLRDWREADRAPYAALNADPAVREYFTGLMTRAECDAQIDRFAAHLAQYGFGFWALEIPGVADCAGFVGLKHLGDTDPIGPGVEIGWRLARAAWGQGYATEAARLCVDFAFRQLGLPELLAWTAAANQPSRRVMQRLGMVLAREFDHPRIPPGHPLRPHVLYRLQGPAAL